MEAGGSHHACGVTTAGEAYCWGLGGYGGLGDGTGDSSQVPVLVSGGHNWASVTTGLWFACGVTTAGEAYCWGSDDYGELGDGGTNTGSLVPVLVSGGHNWASVTAGARHSCGVTTAGEAYCWGFNRWGQFGGGTGDTDTWHTTPQLVSGGLSWASVDGGTEHTCGVTTAGAVYCWGNNAHAELGIGTGPAPPGSFVSDWFERTPVPLGSPWAVKRGDKLLWDGQGSWQWYDMDNQTFTLTRPGNPAVIEVIRDFTDPVHPLLQFYPLNIYLDSPVTLDPQVVTTASGVDAVVNFSMGFAVTLVGQTTSNVTDDVLITSFSLTQVIANWADSGLQAAATLTFW